MVAPLYMLVGYQQGHRTILLEFDTDVSGLDMNVIIEAAKLSHPKFADYDSIELVSVEQERLDQIKHLTATIIEAEARADEADANIGPVEGLQTIGEAFREIAAIARAKLIALHEE